MLVSRPSWYNGDFGKYGNQGWHEPLRTKLNPPFSCIRDDKCFPRFNTKLKYFLCWNFKVFDLLHHMAWHFGPGVESTCRINETGAQDRVIPVEDNHGFVRLWFLVGGQPDLVVGQLWEERPPHLLCRAIGSDESKVGRIYRNLRFNTTLLELVSKRHWISNYRARNVQLGIKGVRRPFSWFHYRYQISTVLKLFLACHIEFLVFKGIFLSPVLSDCVNSILHFRYFQNWRQNKPAVHFKWLGHILFGVTHHKTALWWIRGKVTRRVDSKTLEF